MKQHTIFKDWKTQRSKDVNLTQYLIDTHINTMYEDVITFWFIGRKLL